MAAMGTCRIGQADKNQKANQGLDEAVATNTGSVDS